MEDRECIRFLKWALPNLRMRWPGFRKVRRQVCKRLQRRLQRLNLSGLEAYVEYLKAHREEWQVLDEMCRITISRFYRNKMVFAFLELEVLPYLARLVQRRGGDVLCIWSAGCCGGEEPYTVSILWVQALEPAFPGLEVEILATDTDPGMIERAKKACYQYGSIKELPEVWQKGPFCNMEAFTSSVQNTGKRWSSDAMTCEKGRPMVLSISYCAGIWPLPILIRHCNCQWQSTSGKPWFPEGFS